MSDLADLYQYWGNDLAQGPTGDILPAYRADRSSQRIIRRLLTNPGGGDYPWQPEYGAGLPGKIGLALDIGHLTALIIGQIALEPSVARFPAPQVSVTPILGGVAISVLYFDLAGVGTPLSFNLFAAQPAANSFPVPQLEAPSPPSVHQQPPVEAGRAVPATDETSIPAILSGF